MSVAAKLPFLSRARSATFVLARTGVCNRELSLIKIDGDYVNRC